MRRCGPLLLDASCSGDIRVRFQMLMQLRPCLIIPLKKRSEPRATRSSSVNRLEGEKLARWPLASTRVFSPTSGDFPQGDDLIASLTRFLSASVRALFDEVSSEPFA